MKSFLKLFLFVFACQVIGKYVSRQPWFIDFTNDLPAKLGRWSDAALSWNGAVVAVVAVALLIPAIHALFRGRL